jgi:hypothetical protein
MPSQLPRALRQSAGDLSFVIYLVTVVLCLFRARDLPSVTVGAAGTDVSVGPADLSVAITAALAILRLRTRRTVPSPWLLAATAAFALLVFASALSNGAGAVVAAGKLTELAVLSFATAIFVDSRARLATLLALIVGFCTVATAWGLVEFLLDERGRQASFVGEHDLAALATLAVVVGLAHVYARGGHLPAIALVGLGAGAAGIVLGASLASLLGLYLAAAAIAAVAAMRRSLRRSAIAVTIALCIAVTAGTLALRSGELGFLQAWFGPPPETPGQYAASWSQRLIYVYIGGRVFLDQPLLGTGWHGELPPSEYAEYLPAARERFPDQPAHYFPREDGSLIPQQTYDQLLFELGLVGAALFLVLAGLTVRRALAAAVARGVDERWREQVFVPIGFVAALAGALAGAALFGGSAISAIFWLTVGIAAAELSGQEAP